jgi:hypothetical protein
VASVIVSSGSLMAEGFLHFGGYKFGISQQIFGYRYSIAHIHLLLTQSNLASEE